MSLVERGAVVACVMDAVVAVGGDCCAALVTTVVNAARSYKHETVFFFGRQGGP